MLKNKDELRIEKIVSMRGGDGTVELTHLMEKEQFNGKGRLFAHLKLNPSVSIGYHKHEGDFEGYYFLKGHGLYTENGIEYNVKAGDFTLVDINGSHSIQNTGSEDLELIALILFE